MKKAHEALPRILDWGEHEGTSEILDTAYSARGSAITTMALGTGDEAVRLSAGVIASGWPGWGTAFVMQQISLKWILLRDERLRARVQEAFPRVKVLLWEQTQWDRLVEVDIVGFNGPLNSSRSHYILEVCTCGIGSVACDG